MAVLFGLSSLGRGLGQGFGSLVASCRRPAENLLNQTTPEDRLILLKWLVVVCSGLQLA